MTKLEQIEKTVSELSPDEFKAFAKWFAEIQAIIGTARSQKTS